MMTWIENTNGIKLHVVPQSNWYDDRIDQFFRFEEVEQLSLDKYIPGLNYNKRSGVIYKSYHPTLDDDLKKRIYNFYKRDFELFNYQP
jgi:hypothetical protein